MTGTIHTCRLISQTHMSSVSMIDNSNITIPLGIFIGLLASFVQSLGLTIQRKSHVLNEQLPEHRQVMEYKRPLWLLGFTIFLSSNLVGSLVQIASLPVVILAPLGAVSLLWNAFFARLILGDVFSPWMLLGTILIAGGAVLIAVFGIVPEQTRSLEDLLALFRRPAFIAYFSALGFIVLFCLIVTHICDFALSQKLSQSSILNESDSSASSSVILDVPTNSTIAGPVNVITAPVVSENTPLIDRKPSNTLSYTSHPVPSEHTDSKKSSFNRTRILLAISYASFSGIISGMCLLFAKSGVELLLLSLRGTNQFWRWQSWLLIIALVMFALLQLWYLHKALVLADPTLVCPSAFCFYNVSSIVNGLVYFNQFALISVLHLGLVGLGMCILLAGVWIVSIKSGNGGVDISHWGADDNEPVSISSSVFTCSEGNIQVSEEEISAETLDARTSSALSQRIGPVAMERETVSDSSVPVISTHSTVPARLQESEERTPRDSRRHTVLGNHIFSSGRLSTLTQRRVTLDTRFSRASTSHSSQGFKLVYLLSALGSQ
ncbi:hypothetical protein BDQ17DRAFT_22534 [Cyathus striatus]|nr:hypothetical protein BDQ17DRAFT_22534 [Cyathus striatus]